MSLLVLVIFGPTASGKSAAALAAAERFGGTVVNADSMQIYRDLPILSAAPSPVERARAPHRLYGVLDAADLNSAARWRDMALAEIRAAHAADRLPILVGGTGLYLKGLTDGLAAMPDIPEAVRASVRARLAGEGAPALHRLLGARDPEAAARLDPADSQRIARALEVVEATGRPLSAWQADPPVGPPADLAFRTVAIVPPRAAVYRRCEERLDAMIEEGALAEVRALMARDLDPALPAMKALGVPELAAHLRGELSLTEALARAKTATRRYAKRQFVWAMNHIVSQFVLIEQFSEKSERDFFAFIRNNRLTGR